MTSKVAIANLALTYVGQSPITSLEDGTESAITIKAIYDSVAESAMSDADWSGCVFRQKLTSTGNTPVFDYAYEYNLPTDPSFVRFLNSDKYDDQLRLEGGFIYANVSPFYVRYIGIQTDTEKYGVYLRDNLVNRLAYTLCYHITGLQSMASARYNIWSRELPLLARKDAGNNQRGKVNGGKLLINVRQ